MRKINNKNIRDLIKKNIHVINSMNKKDCNEPAKISNIDSIIQTINRTQQIGEKVHYQSLEDDLVFTNLSIVCISMLSLSIYSPEFEEEIFPKNWLSETEKPNPNFVLSNMFVQMVNYSLATITLLEKGLDNPGRALVRSISELSSQIMILIYFHDDFKEFIKGIDEHTSTEIWYKLFQKNKLRKKMSCIEKEIIGDDEYIKLANSFRKDEHKFFSQAIHHSYVAVNLGAYAAKCDEDRYERSLFGGENCFIVRTLEFLNHTLFYFLAYFFKIINQPKNPNELFWKDAISLHLTIVKLYKELYYPEQEHTNKTQESNMNPQAGSYCSP